MEATTDEQEDVKPTAEAESNASDKGVSDMDVTMPAAVNNEFSYLERNEFTSEMFKIELKNLGRFGVADLKKLLKGKMKLNVSKIKAPNKKDFAYVCFRSEDDKNQAIALLNGYHWKGKKLQASAARAAADPLIKRRNQESHKRKEKPDNEATCPLAMVKYEDQVKSKLAEMEKLIKDFTAQLGRLNPAMKGMVSIQFDGIKESPQVNGYRTKNEFTVGRNAAGEIIVGFRFSSYVNGSVDVSSIDGLPHLPDATKWAAATFQEFVRSSTLLPFNPENNSGHFRQLMVRTSSLTGEIMIVVGIYSTNLSADELTKLKHDLKEFYDNCDQSQFKCTSLYYQDLKRRTAGQTVDAIEHLAGTTDITDSILDLKFRISPLAFFQINTKAAGVLYQQIIELVAPTEKTTVLDICCGTGTIALCIAKHCKQVVGVEIVEDAVKDANFNAQANKITNCKFYAGDSANYIKTMLRELQSDCPPGEELELVAIVDPPRGGLNVKSITDIRAAKAIKRIVYVACSPERAQRNWLDLGRPESKQYRGEPFVPTKAVAVDMFPHTKHVEMLMLLER